MFICGSNASLCPLAGYLKSRQAVANFYSCPETPLEAEVLTPNTPHTFSFMLSHPHSSAVPLNLNCSIWQLSGLQPCIVREWKVLSPAWCNKHNTCNIIIIIIIWPIIRLKCIRVHVLEVNLLVTKNRNCRVLVLAWMCGFGVYMYALKSKVLPPSPAGCDFDQRLQSGHWPGYQCPL